MHAPGNRRPGRWTGYAACACAFLHAAVSFYWGTGGELGLETVGSGAVELASAGNPWIYVALWGVGLVKVCGGFLALALVQPWGSRHFRRWMLLLAGWGGAALLVLYGGVQILVQVLVLTDAIPAPRAMDWPGFYGHLYLWDPWFVLWGLLLGAAALHFTRNGPSAKPRPAAVPALDLGP